MKSRLTTSVAIALLGLVATPAFAQDSGDWAGGYVGMYAGQVQDPDDGGDSILFDKNLDGNYGDTVLTSGGADAFSPGFCDGQAQGTAPASGCTGNDGGNELGVRAGYDWQSGDWVYGVVAEYGSNDTTDAVSAFSTTPARYTMIREIDGLFALRARVGFVFGADGANLIYGTGGFARAKIQNSFNTSNTANTFTNNGDTHANGSQFGVGYERRLNENFTIGLEYIATSLDDEEYRVRAQGPAAATNPFILTNPNGTDFRRSDDELDFDSVRLTLSYRF